MQLRLRAATAGCLVLVTTAASAQSVSIDAEREAPAAPTAPPPAPPPPPRAPTIVKPVPKAVDVVYPEGAEGRAEVVLELTISATGDVTDATLVEGSSPFAERALEAARSWTFEPARRDETPIPAKIRFLVTFEPETSPETPSDAAAPSDSPPATQAPTPARPREPVYEVLVTGERAPIRHRLGQAEVRELPGAFGDPYRAIEALPGVVPIASGLPYFYVRGAPPGNVGYFFDGIPVPLLYHFAAGPGVLHPAFVDHVDLYPGAYPATYGRFAGGIVAGEMAEPGDTLRGEASIRLIDSGAMLETPFADGRGSVMLGGRFSYTGLVLSLLVPEITLNYWDYQGRVRYALDSDDRVEVLFFGSGDLLAETEEEFDGTSETNTIADVMFHRLDLRWDHLIGDGRLRHALMFGADRTRVEESVIVTNSMVGLRSEYEQRLGPKLTLRAGGNVLFESLRQDIDDQTSEDPDDPGSPSIPDSPPVPGEEPFVPDQPTPDEDDDDDDPDFGFDLARDDWTAGAWTELVLNVAPGVELTPGLRADVFVAGDDVAVGVDPRLSARFTIDERLTLVHGLGLVHQAPSFVVPVPGLKPSLDGGLQRAVQHSAGVEYALPGGVTSSVTLFHNLFFNMTDLLSLVQLNNTTGDEVVDFRATGQAYGAELLVRRSLSRKLGGFVSYTLSRSLRSSGELRGPATTDRTHVLNVAASYDLGKNWRFGARALVYSGIPARVAYREAARHPPRTPAFWRLDWRLQKRWMIAAPHAWWGLVFEVLNTTLNKEKLDGNCNAFECRFEAIGPVTVPSFGAEGAF